jgi:hypothetical protein
MGGRLAAPPGLFTGYTNQKTYISVAYQDEEKESCWSALRKLTRG